MNGQFRSAPRGGFPGVGVGCGEIHAFKLCSRSMAVRSTGPSDIFGNIWQGYFLVRRSPWPQSGSRTRMKPSSRGISTGLPEAGRWSKKSKLGSASSSGIHSRIACHGGSMGSKVSMSKGGSGGGGMSMIPSQSPWRRRKNWTSPGGRWCRRSAWWPGSRGAGAGRRGLRAVTVSPGSFLPSPASIPVREWVSFAEAIILQEHYGRAVDSCGVS